MRSLKCLIKITALLFAQISTAQVAVSASKMNVLYPGIINPITVVDTDIPDSNLLLIPSMGTIIRRDTGHYDWMICHRDTNFATLVIKDLHADTLIKAFYFRVNRLPIPVAMMGNKKSKVIANGEYKRQGGIALVLQDFDYDLKCDVLHFEVQYISKGSDTLIKHNVGARWGAEVQDLINIAKPGDEYFFYNIAYRCGCDPMVRYLSEDLYYYIK